MRGGVGRGEGGGDDEDGGVGCGVDMGWMICCSMKVVQLAWKIAKAQGVEEVQRRIVLRQRRASVGVLYDTAVLGIRTHVSLEAGNGGLSLTAIAAQGVRYGMSSQDFT